MPIIKDATNQGDGTALHDLNVAVDTVGAGDGFAVGVIGAAYWTVYHVKNL
ncbi:hypothetical protein ACEQPO_26725 [Bacillus sp. SL00103]